jgi:DNA polymerase-3 subunit gamma/tau
VSYQVFARKYRPQTFDDLVGQEPIVRTLRNAVEQNRLAHAYLFVGPRGIGKTSTARILAKALNCVHGPTTTPCGVCDNCREIAAGNSLDVLEIDGASNNGVEQVRELRDNVRYAPAKSRYKIYIIDEVHMLTSQAFNALLKTLEEPPEHVKFIFATTEPQKVLATILSRCQRFDLHRIPANLIAQHLQFIAGKEKITLEPAAAHAIARGADGGLRDAESMLDQLVAFCGETIAEETAPELQSSLGEEASLLETDRLLELIEQFAAAEGRMKWAPNKKLHFEVAVIKAIQTLGQVTLSEIIDNLAALREGGGRPAQADSSVPSSPRTAAPAPEKKAASKPAAARSTPAAAPSPPTTTVAADVPKIEAAWPKVVQLAYVRRPLIKTWIDSARLLGAEGGSVLLGFPPDQKTVMESLARPANRSFLEALLKEVSGSAWKVKLSLEENSPPAAPAEEIAAERELAPQAADDSIESFKNDPLIKEALELFKGEIKSVTT